MISRTAVRCAAGRPTLAATYGTAAALNAGDGLAIVAGQVLAESHPPIGPRPGRPGVGRVRHHGHAHTGRAGHRDRLAADDIEDLGPEDYLNLIMHKTCWYTTIHPLRVGAMVGSGGTAELAPLVRFGFHFGAAFQIRDDLLNLIGDERIYGKEILGDLYEGKRTLTLVHLIATAQGEDRALVRDYLRRNRAERSDEMVGTVRA